jgi:hypothetical protein
MVAEGFFKGRLFISLRNEVLIRSYFFVILQDLRPILRLLISLRSDDLLTLLDLDTSSAESDSFIDVVGKSSIQIMLLNKFLC